MPGRKKADAAPSDEPRDENPPAVESPAGDPPADTRADSHLIPTVLDRVRDRMKAELTGRLDRLNTAIQAQAESFAGGDTSLAGFLADVTRYQKDAADDYRDLEVLAGHIPTDSKLSPSRVGPVLDLIAALTAKHSPATPDR